MISSQRVIFSDNGTLYDYSYELDDFRASAVTIPYVAGEDYIYVGSELPWNNKYIDIATANDQAADITVEIWFQEEWVEAVDILDRTKSGNNPLASDGHILFSTNDLKGWDLEDDSSDVTGLDGTAIYNMFWTRFSYDQDLGAGTQLNYMGQKFAEDDHLFDYYPDLNNTQLMTAFESGKADWNTQHYMAAQNIIRDLKRRGIIIARDQLLDHQLWQDAAIHKAASIIYGGLGRAYFENLESAGKRYADAIRVKFPKTDKNASGNREPIESTYSTGELIR